MNVKKALLDLNNLRKATGFKVFGAAVRSNLKHLILNTPPKGNVLVLAPHPDDDVIGCGGTIALHVKQKDKVKIIYLSGKGSPREKEAKAAASELGVSDIEFSNNCAIKQLSDYDIIYVPSVLDSNPDHSALAQELAVLIKESDFTGQIWSYEVWTPIYANRLITIDQTFELKIAALKNHASQLKDRNYVEAATGLAMYRAGMFNAGEYAEALFACNKELYLKLLELTSLDNKSFKKI